MAAPTVIHQNGMVVASGLPKPFIGHEQNIQGGLLNHAVTTTAQNMKAQAAHAKAGNVTQRGGGDIIHSPKVAEGGTISGVSFSSNHAKLIGGLNQLTANSTYDKYQGTQPYKVGGRKRRRKTKKHGSRNSSNRRRSFRKLTRRIKRRTRLSK